MNQPTYTESKITAAEKFRGQKKALHKNRLVNIADILPNGRIKITWGTGGQYRENVVDPDDLTPITDSPAHQAASVAENNDALPDHLRNLPKPLLDLARLQMPFMTQEIEIRHLALSYYVELGTARQKSNAAATADGWFAIEGFNTNHRLRSNLVEAGMLERRELPNSTHYEFRISERGRQVLERPEPAAPQPAIAAAAASVPAKIEIRTLHQMIGRPEKLKAADDELAEHINTGWQLIHFQVIRDGDDNGTFVRFITLHRWQEPEPAPSPGEKAAADLPDDDGSLDEAAPDLPAESTPDIERFIPVEIPERKPDPALNPLPIGDWGRAILRTGLDETLAIANQRVADVFTQAYQQSLARHQITIRPLLVQGSDPER